jgi:membrane-associated phospholipid phosphatase
MNRFVITAAAAILAAACHAQQTAPGGIEPDAGTWHTWVIRDVASYRLPPPPDDDQSRAELQDVKANVAGRGPDDMDQIAFWSAGSPAYRWIQIARQEVARHSLGGPAATRAMSLVAVGLNDSMIAAWDSKYAYSRPRPSQLDPAIAAAVPVPDSPSYPSEQMAAAGVAAAVLEYLFPDRKDAIDRMTALECESRLYSGVEFPSDTAAGFALGQTVGQAVVAWARADGSDAAFTGSFPAAPGVWSSTNPSFPLAGRWQPWAIASGDRFRPDPPPAFGSDAMKAQIAAVKDLNRTVDVDRIAWVWQASFIDPWIDTVNQYLFENGMAEDPPKAAQLYALAMVAQHDASIACWDAKYAYLEPRPVQADPQITTLFPTPAHPSFPSGHACASGAAAAVLSAVFPGSAAYFADRAREAGLSTFYAGIHYPNDVDGGLTLGTNVGQAVAERAGLVSRGGRQ